MQTPQVPETHFKRGFLGRREDRKFLGSSTPYWEGGRGRSKSSQQLKDSADSAAEESAGGGRGHERRQLGDLALPGEDGGELGGGLEGLRWDGRVWVWWVGLVMFWSGRQFACLEGVEMH